MNEIKLTQGKIAIVDDEDFDFLNKWKWFYHSAGYAVRFSKKSDGGNRRILYMHRIIINTPSDKQTDHIDGNPLNNCRKNLRICSIAQNLSNSKPHKKFALKNSTYRGVTWYSRLEKWVANIRYNGRQINIGYFEREEDAALAYNFSAIKYHGEFATLNRFS